MRRLLPALLIAMAVLAPAAEAKRKQPLLWATINTCDTRGEPNIVGIRASMPGNGTRQRMYMRFEVQWRDSAKGRYVQLADARSRWIRAGSARFVSQQAGFNFDFQDPAAGSSFKLRGLVRFEWRAFRPAEKGVTRARWEVVRRARRITRAGIEGVRGGRPPGRSDATCLLAGPAEKRGA